MLFSRPGRLMWIAGALLVVSLPARGADVDRFLPDETEFVSFLNVRQMIDSPLFQKHALAKAKEALKTQEEATKILEALGFDPFKDLTSITTAGTSLGPDGKPYFIAHGTFDPAKFEAKGEEVAKNMGDLVKVHKEGDHKLYEVNIPNSPDAIFVALADKNTIVASPDKDYVVGSFARAGGTKKGEVKKEVKDLIEKMDPKLSMWVVMPASALSKSPLAGEEKAKKLFEKTEHVTLSLSFTKEVKLAVTFATKSSDNAKEVAEDLKEYIEQLKGLIALVAGQQKEIAPLVDVIGSIKVETEGKNAMLKSEVSEEVIESGIKKDK